jgi:signal transduction histidine kinase
VLLHFSEPQIASLLPAFLHVDRKLNISAMGPSLAQHIPDVRIGMPFAEAFNILNFSTSQFFENGQGVKPLLVTSRSNDMSLSGAAIFHEEGCLLAVRFILSEEVFANGPLDLSDFGHSEPVVLSAMLIALQKAMLEESHATALELAQERQRTSDMLDRSSRVAGYMAHDFNNLLSIIRLSTDRLVRQFGHDDKVVQLANIIRKTALRGSVITQSLMTLSDQRTDTLQPISADDVITENIAILESVVGSATTLSINLKAANCKSVMSYNDLLNSIINLLINAREAMPQGGQIDLSTSVRRGIMAPDKNSQVNERDEHIVIRIADNGKGMSDTLLSRAFEPLFSSKPNGTGLGLASVRNFALEMGGDVWIESAKDQGATVYLCLPVARQSASFKSQDQNAATGAADGRAQKQRILLVEDEPYALEALSEMLEAEGYFVTPCISGEAALAALERETYDVLLTDIVMFGPDGAEVARQATAAQPSIKVILMSGYVPESALLQPGWRFLNKPMDSAELLRIISA